MLMLNKHSQQGVALIVSLIMLLIMSLLAVSSMNSTVLEEKMAGNYKDKNMAFQAAEAALRDAEFYLRTTNPLPVFKGETAGLYQPTSSGLPRWKLIKWGEESDKYRTYANNTLAGITSPPHYIIEELRPIKPRGGTVGLEAIENRYFRITSYAVGGRDTTVVMLQSIYKR